MLSLTGSLVPPPPPRSVAAADRGDEPQQEDEEGDETATPAFNVDKLRAETKTPFRTVGGCSTYVHVGCVEYCVFHISNQLRCDSQKTAAMVFPRHPAESEDTEQQLQWVVRGVRPMVVGFVLFHLACE